jgi:hypothetical protein
MIGQSKRRADAEARTLMPQPRGKTTPASQFNWSSVFFWVWVNYVYRQLAPLRVWLNTQSDGTAIRHQNIETISCKSMEHAYCAQRLYGVRYAGIKLVIALLNIKNVHIRVSDPLTTLFCQFLSDAEADAASAPVANVIVPSSRPMIVIRIDRFPDGPLTRKTSESHIKAPGIDYPVTRFNLGFPFDSPISPR